MEAVSRQQIPSGHTNGINLTVGDEAAQLHG